MIDAKLPGTEVEFETFSEPPLLDGGTESTNSPERVRQLEEYIKRQVPRFRDAQAKYREVLGKLREAERLNRLHPDTGLPIYRYLLQDVDTLINLFRGVTGESGEPQDVESSTHDLLSAMRSRFGNSGECVHSFQQNGHGGRFSVLLVRLDESYDRIRYSRDRQKALLFKSTYRIRIAAGSGCLYQSERLDEFYLVLPGDVSAGNARALLDKISQAVAQPHDPPAEDIRFGAYVAGTVYPSQAKTLDDILTNLETAMEEAEVNATGVCMYSETMGQRYRYRRTVEAELHKAIQRGFDQFRLVYQPFCGTDGNILGCETLIRWDHPSLGAVSPSVFIPISEGNGSIRILGLWTLFQSCRELAAWTRTGQTGVTLAVNLSPVQFLQKDLVESIINVLTVNKLPPKSLKLEITEGAIMTNPQESIRKMSELREAGIKLCIDDFGTGYSSLAYLRRLPADVLKIDKSFIDDILTNQQNREIVRTIIMLAKNLGLETLAEGVESTEQLDLLRDEGINTIQGYYFSPPVDAPTFRGYLETGGRLPLS